MHRDWVLDVIAQEIGDYCRKWGRIAVTQTKEKYGTVRVYCHFGWNNFQSITHPGYVYNQYPDWIWRNIECNKSVNWIFHRLNFIVVPWQTYIYKKAYEIQVKKHPWAFEEITSCADYPELLGIVTPYICDKHRNQYSGSRYLGDSSNCDMCKDDIDVEEEKYETK